MLTLPTVTGAPVIAPTVNIPTEQTARDNRVREKVRPTAQATASAKERALRSDDKQHQRPSWDPSEHVDYQPANHQPADLLSLAYAEGSDLAHLAQLLSPNTYLGDQSQGYTLRIKLPREVLEKLEQFSFAMRVKGVVSRRYATTTLPNPTVKYLVVI
ncbi:ATP-dependent Lon protease [Thaumasiovibrio sp. DFM-14]|uniref:ATP-dependent Lon protease n=1 Tax=Thaumasiovibrio sp. DFM-14 TaxID=3384792 RepID=UPI0039A3EF16